MPLSERTLARLELNRRRADRDREINENLRREFECGVCAEMRQKLNNRLDHLRKEQSVLANSAADVQGQINQLQGQWIMIRDKHKEVSAQIQVLEEMAAEPGEDET